MTKTTTTPSPAATIETSNVTGRDGLIITKGLLYAIGRIQTLDESRQEWSDMADMCALVRATVPRAHLAWVVWGVESHLGHKINLFPDSDMLSDDEINDGDQLRSEIDGFESKHTAMLTALTAPPSGVVRFID